jgi:hypothetical protein
VEERSVSAMALPSGSEEANTNQIQQAEPLVLEETEEEEANRIGRRGEEPVRAVFIERSGVVATGSTVLIFFPLSVTNWLVVRVRFKLMDASSLHQPIYPSDDAGHLIQVIHSFLKLSH